MNSFVCAAVVQKGKIEIDGTSRRLMADWGKRQGDGLALRITIEEKQSKRSLQANRTYWGYMVTPLAEYLGYDRDEIEDLHEALLCLFAGTHAEKLTGREVPNERSSRMSRKRFHEFMEWTVRFAAKEHGVVLVMPDEVDA